MHILNLFEGISPVVYHTTKIKNAAEILKHDRFMLSIDNSSREADFNSGKLQYWMSTARSIYNAFSEGMSQSVTFVLDGRKLSNNFSGTPVSYFSKSRTLKGSDYNEMEDRIYSDNRFIEKASRYILKIIIKTDSGVVSPDELNYIKEISNIAMKIGISIEYRIKNKRASIEDLHVGSEHTDEQESYNINVSEIVNGIFAVLDGRVNRFSEIKQKYPEAVPYLIGSTPEEFVNRFRSLLSKVSHNNNIDPLVNRIKRSYGRNVKKFAHDLFLKTNAI